MAKIIKYTVLNRDTGAPLFDSSVRVGLLEEWLLTDQDIADIAGAMKSFRLIPECRKNFVKSEQVSAKLYRVVLYGYLLGKINSWIKMGVIAVGAIAGAAVVRRIRK